MGRAAVRLAGGRAWRRCSDVQAQYCKQAHVQTDAVIPSLHMHMHALGIGRMSAYSKYRRPTRPRAGNKLFLAREQAMARMIAVQR